MATVFAICKNHSDYAVFVQKTVLSNSTADCLCTISRSFTEDTMFITHNHVF